MQEVSVMHERLLGFPLQRGLPGTTIDNAYELDKGRLSPAPFPQRTNQVR